MVLEAYRRKRRFNETPEPDSGRRHAGRLLRFVVQEHRASHLHYDFRLELDGVLKSWAVPKGMPAAGERRLAVMTEDHPLEYRTFEGVIPEGNYGAGTVTVWDGGTYRAEGESTTETERYMNEGLRRGKLHFSLEGKKLKGAFSMVRMRGGKGDNWLLLKKREAAVGLRGPGAGAKREKRTGKRSSVNPRELKAAGAIKAPFPSEVRPMLAALAETPFDRPDWLFEIKWDGYRVLAEVRRETVRIYSRNGITLNERFPRIAHALEELGATVLLDGELVVVDENGMAEFQLLQNYLRSGEGYLVYYVFDLLYANGYDCRELPLIKRKELLQKILPPLPEVRLSEYVRGEGSAFYNAAKKNNAEGIIGKDAASPYRSGIRSTEWLKMKIVQRQEAVIAGYTRGQGEREYFGALVLGVYEYGELKYIGHAGGGFDTGELASLYRRLAPLVRQSVPFSLVPKTNAPVTWVEPRLVCEVKFSGWTRDGRMRQPIYLGLRDDKEPRDVRRETVLSRTQAVRTSPPAVIAGAVDETIGGKKVRLSNLSKVFWPDEGYTKKDSIDYYRQVAPVLLPYLKDRPQALHRYPDGITGKSFFQKDVGGIVPAWVTTLDLTSEEEGRLTYLLCQDTATLLFLVNLGCIDINVWNSRVPSLDSPDYMVLDFDPLDVPFERVVEAVLQTHDVLENIEAEHFVKTSGATGLHVYVPLGAAYTFEQAEEFAQLVAALVNELLPDITSIVRAPARREKKVYLDYLQNRKAQTMAAPYCVRPRKGAPVSTPLRWDEVNKRLDPRSFTMRNAPERLDRIGDLWRQAFSKGIDMPHCLDRLEKLYRMPVEKRRETVKA